MAAMRRAVAAVLVGVPASAACATTPRAPAAPPPLLGLTDFFAGAESTWG
jgi:hypothetical protein